MPCVNGRTRVRTIIYSEKIGTTVLLEKVRAGRFCRAGDSGSISKIPKKEKADVEARVNPTWNSTDITPHIMVMPVLSALLTGNGVSHT